MLRSLLLASLLLTLLTGPVAAREFELKSADGKLRLLVLASTIKKGFVCNEMTSIVL